MYHPVSTVWHLSRWRHDHSFAQCVSTLLYTISLECQGGNQGTTSLLCSRNSVGLHFRVCRLFLCSRMTLCISGSDVAMSIMENEWVVQGSLGWILLVDSKRKGRFESSFELMRRGHSPCVNIPFQNLGMNWKETFIIMCEFFWIKALYL